MKNASLTEALHDRRKRIAAVGYDFAAQPKQQIESCNLCGEREFVVIAHRDRYGYPATADGCRRCGLVFLNPQMTADAYAAFYGHVYRPLVSAYHGRTIDARSIQDEQREYAAERAQLLAPYLSGRPTGRLLDIGGSTGVVSHAFCRRFDLKGTVIDPSPLEIDEAKALGLETIRGLVEQWDSGDRQFEVVAMCQTVDHLLDIAGTLDAVRRLLTPEGVFFIDIVDFRAAYLRNWSTEDAVKIDHPYYLTQSTMEAFLSRAGLRPVRVDFATDHLHISYVCRPGAAEASVLPSSVEVTRHFHEIRYVQNAPRPAAL